MLPAPVLLFSALANPAPPPPTSHAITHTRACTCPGCKENNRTYLGLADEGGYGHGPVRAQVACAVEPSPLSIFGQALTLSDGSPADSSAPDNLTPGITPELTTRKPRRGSRFGRAAHGTAVPAAAGAGGTAAQGITSPGIAAFLREQALRDAARRGLPIASDAFLRSDGDRPGLSRAPSHTATIMLPSSAAPQLTSPPAAGAAANGFAFGPAVGRQPLQEPAQCLTPPRSQRRPLTGGAAPDAGEARLNRVRPPPAPAIPAPSKSSLSLDRTSSLSRSSSGSAFSRASSLNDAKVCAGSCTW